MALVCSAVTYPLLLLETKESRIAVMKWTHHMMYRNNMEVWGKCRLSWRQRSSTGML
jgi:hypothetical protein